MPGTAELQILVRTGAADPTSMSLEPGQPIGPLSVGRMGTWRVVAPGVLEEHGFVYFNGTELFLQSTDPLSPVLADGAPIPGAWTAVRAPCEIAVGGARLWFGSPEPSFAPPFMDEASELARQPFVPRVQGNDFEAATPRCSPSRRARHARGRCRLPGRRSSRPLPVFGPGATPQLVPPPSAAGRASREAGQSSFLAARMARGLRAQKALAVLMVPLAWAVWVIFTDAPAPPPRPKPAASASAQPSGSSAAPTAAMATTASPAATEAPASASSARTAPDGRADGLSGDDRTEDAAARRRRTRWPRGRSTGRRGSTRSWPRRTRRCPPTRKRRGS